MPDVEFTNLFAVVLIALLAPLLLGLAPRLRVPAVVLEIVAGIVVGPHGLGWIEVDLPVQIVAVLGLAFLLFLAGLEIDVHQLRGQVLRLAVLGYLVTLVLGGIAGAVFSAVGWVNSALLLAVTLSATSLGLVVPVLKDARKADSTVGQFTIAAASVADFAAVLVLLTAAAWSHVKVPALILHGQYDWIMGREDSELIAQIVNASVPGAARFIEVPEMGHGGQHYLSMADAFAGKQAPFDPKIIRTMTDWLDQKRKKPAG